MSNDTFEQDISLEELCENAQSWTLSCSSDSQEPNQDSNSGRARHALVAVNAFSNSVGSEEHESVQEAMKDLLTNLHHLGDKMNLDMSDLLDRAYRTYQSERDCL